MPEHSVNDHRRCVCIHANPDPWSGRSTSDHAEDACDRELTASAAFVRVRFLAHPTHDRVYLMCMPCAQAAWNRHPGKTKVVELPVVLFDAVPEDPR